MTTGGVAGVVLAAGEGTRMGVPKARLELDGTPLVTGAVATIRDGGCTPVAVVTGADDTAVADLVGDAATLLHNPAWRDGMGGSVRLALTWAGGVRPPVSALLILPVDTPGIGAAVIRRLLQHPAGDRALVATYHGRPRNPVVLPAAIWPDVAARVTGDAGARTWLRANPDRVVEIDCTDLADPSDLDTPEDLDRWTSRVSTSSPIPTTGASDGA